MEKLVGKIYLLFFFNCILKVSLALPEKQCIGKHRIPLKTISNYEIRSEINETLDLINFDSSPYASILENNGHTILITLRYNRIRLPTINFRSKVLPDTYRFEFLYFQWLENTTVPAELHAVFYNIKLDNFQEAMGLKNNIVVFAFGLKMEPLIETQYAALQGNLQHVRIGGSKRNIKVLPLQLWLTSSMRDYILYEGFLTFFNCEAQVLFVDFVDNIELETELLKEFEQLQTYDGAPLMEQYELFSEPKGSVLVNFGGPGGGGMALVDEDMGSRGSTFQRLEQFEQENDTDENIIDPDNSIAFVDDSDLANLPKVFQLWLLINCLIILIVN